MKHTHITPSQPSRPLQIYRSLIPGFYLVSFSFLLAFAFQLGMLIARSQGTIQNQPLPTPPPSPQPSTKQATAAPQATPTPALHLSEKISFYTLQDQSFVPLTDVSTQAFNNHTSPLLYDQDHLAYYIDNDQIMRLDLNQPQTPEPIYPLPNPQTVSAIYLNPDHAAINLVQTIGSPTDFPPYEQASRLDLANRELTITSPHMKTVLYGIYRILDSHSDQSIALNIGGDGCGGYGNIATFNQVTLQSLLQIGAGCVNEPRYIQYLPQHQTILLASVIPDTYDAVTLQDLIWYDPIHQTQQTLLTLNPRQEAETRILASPNESQIALIQAGQLSIYQVDTKSLGDPITLSATVPIKYNSYVWLNNNLIYTLDNNSHKLYILNPDDGTVTDITYNDNTISNQSPNLHILGTYQDHLLLYSFQPTGTKN